MNTEDQAELAQRYGRLLSTLSTVRLSATELRKSDINNKVITPAVADANGLMEQTLAVSIATMRSELTKDPNLVRIILATADKGDPDPMERVRDCTFASCSLRAERGERRREDLSFIMGISVRATNTLYEAIEKEHGLDVLRASLKEQARVVTGSFTQWMVAIKPAHQAPEERVDRAVQMKAAEAFGKSLAAARKKAGIDF